MAVINNTFSAYAGEKCVLQKVSGDEN
jgi:hypothetical protein